MDPEQVSKILERSESGDIKKPNETLGLTKIETCPDCNLPLIGRPAIDAEKRLVAIFACPGACNYAWAKKIE